MIRILALGLVLSIPASGCFLIGPPQSVTHPDGVTIERDIVFAEVDGEPLLLDLYTPENQEGPFPVVVWIFGGGWFLGDRSKIVIAPIATKGYIVASIDYRLSDEALFPAQVHDCKSAIRFLRANAKRFNLMPDKIGVIGPSAGGHLAAMLGTTNGDPRLEGEVGTTGVSSHVQAAACLFPPTDLRRLYDDDPNLAMNYVIRQFLDGSPEEKPEMAALASPVSHVSRDDPPFLLIHGTDDSTVPVAQSRILHAALVKAGVDSELHLVEDGGHGNTLLAREEVQRWIEGFFDRTLKGVRPGKRLSATE